jgi:hypothetical protein
MGEPDPGALGIVKLPVAEAGIGADHDRYDLEQHEHGGGRRDQEQHEQLLLGGLSEGQHGRPKHGISLCAPAVS